MLLIKISAENHTFKQKVPGATACVVKILVSNLSQVWERNKHYEITWNSTLLSKIKRQISHPKFYMLFITRYCLEAFLLVESHT
jgi:hypothetical protein